MDKYVIKVTSCRSPSLWYKDHVGHELTLTKHPDTDKYYYWTREDTGYINVVYKEDAIMLTEEPEVSPEEAYKEYLSQFNDQDKNFTLLTEECSEVIQVLCKIDRFGLNDVHPSKGITNRDELVQEIGDICAVVGILTHQGLFTKDELELAIAKKLEKLPNWY